MDLGAGADSKEDETNKETAARLHGFNHVIQLSHAVSVQLQVVVVVAELVCVEGLHRCGVGTGHVVLVDWSEWEGFQRLVKYPCSAARIVEGLVTQFLQPLPDHPDAVDAGVVHHEERVVGWVAQCGHAVSVVAPYQLVDCVVQHLVLYLTQDEDVFTRVLKDWNNVCFF